MTDSVKIEAFMLSMESAAIGLTLPWYRQMYESTGLDHFLHLESQAKMRSDDLFWKAKRIIENEK